MKPFKEFIGESTISGRRESSFRQLKSLDPSTIESVSIDTPSHGVLNVEVTYRPRFIPSQQWVFTVVNGPLKSIFEYDLYNLIRRILVFGTNSYEGIKVIIRRRDERMFIKLNIIFAFIAI